MARKRKRKTWRERHPDVYREKQRMLMRKRRMEAKLTQAWETNTRWYVRVGTRWAQVDALAAAWLMSQGAEVRLT